jgi:hypothetical protein
MGANKPQKYVVFFQHSEINIFMVQDTKYLGSVAPNSNLKSTIFVIFSS